LRPWLTPGLPFSVGLTEEASAFEHYPLFELIIKMRKWDEQAKVENKPLPGLDHYRKMIIHHLETSDNTNQSA